MSKFFGIKEQLSTREKNKEEKAKDRGWFMEIGMEFVKKNYPGVAREYFKKAGLKEKEANLLIEDLASKNKTIEKQDRKSKKNKELGLREKLRLKELALDSVARNQNDFAKICFKEAGLTDKETESLSSLNLIEIEIEKEKLNKELEELKEKTE